MNCVILCNIASQTLKMFSSQPYLSASDTSILCFLLTVHLSNLLFLFCFFPKGRCGIKSWKKNLISQLSPFYFLTKMIFCNVTVQEICLNHQDLMRLDVPFPLDCIAEWWDHVTDKQPFIPNSIYTLHRVLNQSHNYVFFSSTDTGTVYH